jgi:hypothetical protein
MMMNIVIPEGIRKLIKLLPIKTIAVCAVVYFGWGLYSPSGSWRYKVTVVVETPEGIKTGSAVRQGYSGVGIPALGVIGGGGYSGMSKGEAVAVDLGKRGVLFAVTQGLDDYRIVYEAFPFHEPVSPEGVRYYRSLKNVKAVLTPKQYPQFVHFKDITDPKTVEQWCEAETCASYEKIFVGRKTIDFKNIGLKIKEVAIEMTEEPVTRAVDKLLPWLQDRHAKRVMGYLGGPTTQPYDDPTKTYLNGIEFKQGVK